MSNKPFLKIRFLTGIIVLLLSVFVQNILAQRDIKQLPYVETVVNKKCGFSAEIFGAFSLLKTAQIFLLMYEKDFTKLNLNRLFTCISKEYPKISLIKVTGFSDSDNLKIAVRNFLKPPSQFDPPEDTSNEDCKSPTNAVRPCPTGYFRALFYRDNYLKKEEFSYSPNPNKQDTVTVTLQDRTRKKKVAKQRKT